ncbi:MAG: class I SAM-dependent methyltransferase [Trebonia sp.]
MAEAHEPERDLDAELSNRERWDTRYREKTSLWSGKPNPTLVSEIGALKPGTALEVGAGEGADAIWLAKQGWTVTGVDISTPAGRRCRRGRNAAGRRAPSVRPGDQRPASPVSGTALHRRGPKG